jgi:hypothetical protein
MNQIQSYVKIYCEKKTIDERIYSLYLSGLELMCGQYLQILSLQLLEQSEIETAPITRSEILVQLGKAFRSVIVTVQSSTPLFSPRSRRGSEIITTLGKILLLVLTAELRSRSHRSDLSDDKILQFVASIVSPILKELALSSDQMTKLFSLLDPHDPLRVLCFSCS